MNKFVAKYGWKTIAAAVIIGGCGAAQHLALLDASQVDLILALAAGLGIIGIGHKLDKARNGCSCGK